MEIMATTKVELEQEQQEAILQDSEANIKEGHDVEITTSSRRGQNRFKRSLVQNTSANGVCKCAMSGCSITGESFLVASHIVLVQWQYSNPAEKVDHNNGILLCPNHDLFFDLRLFIFDGQGNIPFSPKLSKESISAFKLNGEIKLDLSAKKKYISLFPQVSIQNYKPYIV